MGLSLYYIVMPRASKDRTYLFISHAVIGIHASALVLQYNHLSTVALGQRQNPKTRQSIQITTFHIQ
jgi:hypothetical protein